MKKARQGKIGKITKLQAEQKSLLEQVLRIGLTLDKAKTNKTIEAKFDPSKIYVVFQFDAEWRREYNTLLADDAENLYLADAKESERGLEIKVGCYFIPIKDATDQDLAKVSLKEALLWYSRCDDWATGSSGSVELLCRMAAERL